jgi:hypothetical protein
MGTPGRRARLLAPGVLSLLSDVGGDDREVELRAETCGRTRSYTLVYELRDVAGNRSRYPVVVTVPGEAP